MEVGIDELALIFAARALDGLGERVEELVHERAAHAPKPLAVLRQRHEDLRGQSASCDGDSAELELMAMCLLSAEKCGRAWNASVTLHL